MNRKCPRGCSCRPDSAKSPDRHWRLPVPSGVRESYRRAEQYQLIYADSRHFIPSCDPGAESATLSLETFADDLDALRIELGIDQWIVLGHSVHAQIALAYARKYPEHTSRLVLIGGVSYRLGELAELQASFWEETASPERKAQHARNRQAIESTLAETPEERRFAVNYVGDAAQYWADPAYDAAFLWEGVETSPATFGRLFEFVPTRAQMRPLLERVDVPTLLLLGKLDFAIPHVAWEELIKDLDGFDYILLERDGHNPMTEAPARFDRALLDWLNTI